MTPQNNIKHFEVKVKPEALKRMHVQNDIQWSLFFKTTHMGQCNVVNDINYSLKTLKIILFADDSTAYASHESLTDLTDIVNEEVTELAEWFLANKLSLNVDKTNSVLFTTRNINRPIEIKINGQTLENKPFVKFLGITVDSKLTWNEHIRLCKNQLASVTYAINAAKRHLSSTTLLTLYYALVYSRLSYGILLWGASNQNSIKSLFLQQKKVVRVIAKSSYLAHSDPLFSRLNVLKINGIYNLALGTFMYRVLNKTFPGGIDISTIQSQDLHAYSTRTRTNIHIPHCRTKLALNSFIHQGPRLWNNLSTEIVNTNSLSHFRQKLSSHLLNNNNTS